MLVASFCSQCMFARGVDFVDTTSISQYAISMQDEHRPCGKGPLIPLSGSKIVISRTQSGINILRQARKKGMTFVFVRGWFRWLMGGTSCLSVSSRFCMLLSFNPAYLSSFFLELTN